MPQAGWERQSRRYADDRFHSCESASLGSRGKGGEQKQAVGRSRGGRNTKIHALADTKGRLIAILLTGGEAHDCPVAERLTAPHKQRASARLYDCCEGGVEFMFGTRLYDLDSPADGATRLLHTIRRFVGWRGVRVQQNGEHKGVRDQLVHERP